jgi:hypothetical protein
MIFVQGFRQRGEVESALSLRRKTSTLGIDPSVTTNCVHQLDADPEFKFLIL